LYYSVAIFAIVSNFSIKDFNLACPAASGGKKPANASSKFHQGGIEKNVVE